MWYYGKTTYETDGGEMEEKDVEEEMIMKLIKELTKEKKRILIDYLNNIKELE